MSLEQVFDFGHHLIALPTIEGRQGKASPTLSRALKAIERLNGPLAMVGRHELAVLPPLPDIFTPNGILTGYRNSVWNSIKEATHIHWVTLIQPSLTTGKVGPGNSGGHLPNVSLGLVAGSPATLTEDLRRFREYPAKRRMLLLADAQAQYDLSGTLDEICWVVACTAGAANRDRDEAILEACRDAEIALLFHRLDACGIEDAAGLGDLADCRAGIPEHPFGSELQLDRPKLCAFAAVDELAGRARKSSGKVAGPEAPRVTDTGPEAIIEALPADAPPPEPPAQEVASDLAAVPLQPADISQADTPAEEIALELVGSDVPDVSGIAPADLDDFTRLDRAVRDGLRTLFEIGPALKAIHERELWRMGGFTSWNQYCENALGLSRVHANRIMAAAEIAQAIRKGLERVGSPLQSVLPTAESQVRPLVRLSSAKQQLEVWNMAVSKAEGRQPTAKIVDAVVTELVADRSKSESKPPQPKQRSREEVLEAFRHLRQTVAEQQPREAIEAAIGELERLLWPP
jgi:hypothetical protein